LKPSAFLINTARGAIIDEQALTEVLEQGRIAGAGLDVFATEPLPATSRLRSMSNVLLTPHIGWQVADVLHEFVEIAAVQLESWLDNRLEVLSSLVFRDGSGGFLQDSIDEGFPLQEMVNLFVTVESFPVLLGSLSQLEHHGQTGASRAAALRSAVSQTDR
jgi:hypothetical protein